MARKTIEPGNEKFRSFGEARTFARSLKIKNKREWLSYDNGKIPRLGRRPADIPSNPEVIYAGKGWKHYWDWIGTDVIVSQKGKFRSFQNARLFVRKLKLRGQIEWQAYCRGKMPRLRQRPADIPASPNIAYADKGWKGLGDWLGDVTMARRCRNPRPFQTARFFVHKLKLKNVAEWQAYCKGKLPQLERRPVDIPATPDDVYEDKGWKGYGDWLGSNAIAPRSRNFLPFFTARAFVRKLRLKSVAEWRAYCGGELSRLGRRPIDIPVCPQNVYASKGWKGYGDWLGSSVVGRPLMKFRSFREARLFARNLKLKSQTEWQAYCTGKMPRLGRRPADIPATPNEIYADSGWDGYGDWVGNFREIRSFRRAREFSRKLKLKSAGEWQAYCNGKMPRLGRLPADIPASPQRVYADEGWTGYVDWLGTHTKPRPFREARKFVRKLKLKKYVEWYAYCRGKMPRLGRRPADIPVYPDSVYADKGWKGMGDWLGAATIVPHGRNFRSFQQARKFVRKLKLIGQAEWLAYCKGELRRKGRRPADIPACPSVTYEAAGWKGLGDWLGTGAARRSRNFRSFHAARSFARKLKIRNVDEWLAYCNGKVPRVGRRPVDVPARPDTVYIEKGWKSYGDWLGTGAVPGLRAQKVRSFRNARAFARSLKLESKAEWLAYSRGKMSRLGTRPADIPATPRVAYADKGWKGYGDWLGNGRAPWMSK